LVDSGFILHYSHYGNWILAMGGDKVSARNAGIPTERMTILLFMCSSVSAAFVGLSQAILYNSAQVSSGQSYIFNAIIAVVVGGVLLTGGYGSVFGVVLDAYPLDNSRRRSRVVSRKEPQLGKNHRLLAMLIPLTQVTLYVVSEAGRA
jgi:ABC-type xylose transport system permease subunit